MRPFSCLVTPGARHPVLTWWMDDLLSLLTSIEWRFCPGPILVLGPGPRLSKLSLIEQILHLTVQGHHLSLDVFREQHRLLCGRKLGLLGHCYILPGLWVRPAQEQLTMEIEDMSVSHKIHPTSLRVFPWTSDHSATSVSLTAVHSAQSGDQGFPQGSLKLHISGLHLITLD